MNELGDIEKSTEGRHVKNNSLKARIVPSMLRPCFYNSATEFEFVVNNLTGKGGENKVSVMSTRS